MSQDQEEQRRRALVIMRVRGGELTAKQGAQLLGVSRKTYYELEKRALAGMLAAMEEKPKGRPPQPVDPEKEKLLDRVEALEEQLSLAKKTIEVKELLYAYELQCEKERRRCGAVPEKKQNSEPRP